MVPSVGWLGTRALQGTQRSAAFILAYSKPLGWQGEITGHLHVSRLV